MSTPHRRSSPKILIVDDDADWRDYLRLSLTELGYESIEASGGEEALEVLREESCDLVLLDLYMPDLDGEAVASRLPQPAPPIVFLTTAPADEIGALKRGPHYYLPKGASQAQLGLLVEALRR